MLTETNPWFLYGLFTRTTIAAHGQPRPYDDAMRAVGLIVGGVLCVSGIVWMLQGMGSQFVPQSFMTNSSQWIVIGAITTVVGLATIRWSWLRR